MKASPIETPARIEPVFISNKPMKSRIKADPEIQHLLDNKNLSVNLDTKIEA